MAASVNPNAPVVAIPIVFVLARQFTASAAAVCRFKLPQRGRIIRFAVNMRAKGGTQGVSTADLKAATVSVLTALPNMASGAAGTHLEGTLDATKVVQNAEVEMTVDITVTGGSSPTIDDITVQIDLIPE